MTDKLIFKSRQVNTDPKPYLYPDGHRNSVGGSYAGMWPKREPRPEFNLTRDPYPVYWAGHRYPVSQIGQLPSNYEWEPRPEFDRPVNPILVAYREHVSKYRLDSEADAWLFALDSFDAFGGFRTWEAATDKFHSITLATTDQIGHARRVLTRLAGWSA